MAGPCSLLFSDTLSDFVETVCADTGHGDKVVGRTETANGQVAAVLDGLVATGGRHILRHFGGGELEEALECVLRGLKRARGRNGSCRYDARCSEVHGLPMLLTASWRLDFGESAAWRVSRKERAEHLFQHHCYNFW